MMKPGRRSSSRHRSLRAWRRSARMSIGAAPASTSAPSSSSAASSACASTMAAADDGSGGGTFMLMSALTSSRRARGFIQAMTRSAARVQSM